MKGIAGASGRAAGFHGRFAYRSSGGAFCPVPETTFNNSREAG